MIEERYLSFGDVDKITPVSPEALSFAEAILELTQAKTELELAKKSVPNYTAQWSDIDYYMNEQDQFNQAAQNLFNILKRK